jgi:hypothetical protein
MGNCNCKDALTEPYVEVEDVQIPVGNKTFYDDQKLIRIKSMKYQGENLGDINKICEIIETNDKSQFTSNQQGDSKNDATDFNSKKIAESIILENDINEEEQKRLKDALFKHFLFKDMDDEILYI